MVPLRKRVLVDVDHSFVVGLQNGKIKPPSDKRLPKGWKPERHRAKKSDVKTTQVDCRFALLITVVFHVWTCSKIVFRVVPLHIFFRCLMPSHRGGQQDFEDLRRRATVNARPPTLIWLNHGPASSPDNPHVQREGSRTRNRAQQGAGKFRCGIQFVTRSGKRGFVAGERDPFPPVGTQCHHFIVPRETPVFRVPLHNFGYMHQKTRRQSSCLRNQRLPNSEPLRIQ